MNNLDNQAHEETRLETIERQYWVDQKNALDRLHDNKDFQEVVLKGFFKDLAINQTSLLATDHVVKSGARTAVMEKLIAISHLQDHFITITNLGSVTEDDEFGA